MDQVIEIDTEGAVILVCGEGDRQKRLRVCSKMLSKASPVFKSMLSPQYQEGAALHAQGHTEISLPEDNANDMETICQIAHHQNDKVALRITGCDNLVRMSSLCDKYDLRQLLRAYAKVWITEKLYSRYARIIRPFERKKLLVAAYRFGHAEMFAMVGREIVVESTEDSGKPSWETWAQDIGAAANAVFDGLAAERKRIRDVVSDQVAHILELEHVLQPEDEFEPPIGCIDPDCTYGEKRLRYVLDILRKGKLWPHTVMQKCSVQHIWDAMEAAEHWAAAKTMEEKKIVGCGDDNCFGVDEDYDPSHIAAKFEECRGRTSRMRRRLCLECVSEGEVLLETCDHGHD